jgi:hypothetical protein
VIELRCVIMFVEAMNVKMTPEIAEVAENLKGRE